MQFSKPIVLAIMSFSIAANAQATLYPRSADANLYDREASAGAHERSPEAELYQRDAEAEIGARDARNTARFMAAKRVGVTPPP